MPVVSASACSKTCHLSKKGYEQEIRWCWWPEQFNIVLQGSGIPELEATEKL
jgi:hypothetical protein